MKKTASGIAAVCLSLLLLGTGVLACSSNKTTTTATTSAPTTTVAPSTSTAPVEKTKVKVVMATYFGSWLNTYAISAGLVTSPLVDVTIDQSPSFDDQMAAGNYPMGVMSATAFAIACDKNSIPFQAVGIYLANRGTDEARGVNIVYTKVGSTLKSAADLKGKKVGIPGLQSGAASIFLGMLQSQYGITQDQMTLVDSPVAQLISLLGKGDLDAALLNGDPSVQTYNNPAYQVLWNVDQAFQAKYGTYAMATFLTVQADFLKQNPAVAKAVYDLLKASSAYGVSHIAELSQLYIDQFGGTGTAAAYQNAYKNHYAVTFDFVEGKVQEGALAIFSFVQARGIITKLPDPAKVFFKW